MMSWQPESSALSPFAEPLVSGLAGVAALPRLRRLTVNGSERLTDDSLRAITESETITELAIISCSNITDAGVLSSVMSMTQVTERCLCLFSLCRSWRHAYTLALLLALRGHFSAHSPLRSSLTSPFIPHLSIHPPTHPPILPFSTARIPPAPAAAVPDALLMPCL